MIRAFAIAVLAVLAACDGGSDTKILPEPVTVNAMDPRQVEIGPVIDRQNRSIGMPVHPAAEPGGGYSIDLSAGGEPHYVTFHHGSLIGKRRITMTYRVEADPGVEFYPPCCPGLPASITLYFQREGDDWSGRGKYEAYRWWATFASQPLAGPGVFVIEANLDSDWTAIQTSHALVDGITNPDFRNAVHYADRVGFTFGGGDGYGHGVRATGEARIVVLDFTVE